MLHDADQRIASSTHAELMAGQLLTFPRPEWRPPDANSLLWQGSKDPVVKPSNAMLYLSAANGRGTGPGTAAHWEAQPPVVAQGAAAAVRTRPLPQPTASSLSGAW
jgi:hypothetical protein